MVQIKCPRCHGEGGEYIREEEEGFGPLAWHSCYHCCEEGYVDLDEDAFLDMVNDLASEATADNRERQPVDLLPY